MLEFLRVTCQLCTARVSKRHAHRGQVGRRAYVCNGCYEQWEKAGRTCLGCGTSVHGMQEVGVFVDQKGLGHADCSGVRLVSA